MAPQRLTEYMLVVTTSVATDTAAAPVSSSHSHFSLSLVFSMLIQCGHGCLLELRTLVIFLLVVFLWPPSSSVICRSPQTTMKPDARSTLGEEGRSTVRLTTTGSPPFLGTERASQRALARGNLKRLYRCGTVVRGARCRGGRRRSPWSTSTLASGLPSGFGGLAE